MAKLWIREYKDGAGAGPGRALPLAAEPGTDQAPLTFSTSAASAAFAASTRFITMIADADFHYLVGTTPTATTNCLKVPANTHCSIGVPPGAKVAVIAAS